MSFYKVSKSNFGIYLVILLSMPHAFQAMGPADFDRRANNNTDNRQASDLRQHLYWPIRPPVDRNAALLDLAISSMKEGFRDAIIETTSAAGKDSLKFLPNAISKFGVFLASFIYKKSFGSRGLTWNDLAKVNNYIYKRCLQYATIAAGSFDKTRRADAIKDEQEGARTIDAKWKKRSDAIMRVFHEAYCYLEQALPCYDLRYLKVSRYGLKLKLARIVHAASTQDNEKIADYIKHGMRYLRELIEHFSKFNSLAEARQQHEETRYLLSALCDTFEQIAEFVDSDLNGQTRQNGMGSRKPFLKLSAQSSAGSMTGLVDSFLGSSAGSSGA